jgi:hypothetical protein
MAESPNQGQHQDVWSEGLANFTEAARHSVTASRLMTAGAVAFTAAATAYLWDADRRNGLLQSSKKMTDDMMSFWGSFPAKFGKSDGDTRPPNA